MNRRSIPTSVSVLTRDDGQRLIVGYASVFYSPDDPGTEYQIGKRFVERIGETAFNRALKEKQDVRGLFNHDSNTILGRTKNGTMRLSVDQRGLRYEIDPPETQAAEGVVAAIARGDVDGSSFGFVVRGEQWEDDEENQRNIRTVQDVDLFDVGPVVYPAYDGTSSGMRHDTELNEMENSFLRYQKRQQLLTEIRHGSA